MIRLFRWLIWGDAHLHRWTTVRQGSFYESEDRVVGCYYDCRCDVCGRYKSFRI